MTAGYSEAGADAGAPARTAARLGRRAPVAQGIERAPPEREVAGSIPAGRIARPFGPARDQSVCSATPSARARSRRRIQVATPLRDTLPVSKYWLMSGCHVAGLHISGLT